MNRLIKRQWVKALRSGEYKQNKNLLCSVDKDTKEEKFCCLGVLCDIALDQYWNLSPSGTYYEIEGSYGRLPASLNRLGVTNEEENALVRMNDYGKSFKEIADWIENNL